MACETNMNLRFHVPIDCRHFLCPCSVTHSKFVEGFSLLIDFVRKSGLAAVIATHNLDLAARMDRIVRLEEGALVAA